MLPRNEIISCMTFQMSFFILIFPWISIQIVIGIKSLLIAQIYSIVLICHTLSVYQVMHGEAVFIFLTGTNKTVMNIYIKMSM